MEFSRGSLVLNLARLGAVVAIAATLGACSVMPDWLGGDSGSAADQASAGSADQSSDSAAGQTASNDESQSGQFPDLANTPDRPAAPSTPDDQKKVAASLAAARAQQQYSADDLRAGQEKTAPPPGAPQPDEVAEVDTGSSASADNAQAAGDDTSDTAPDNTEAPTAPTAPANPAPAGNEAAPAAAPTTAVASTSAPTPSGGGLPAVPASSVPGAQSVMPSDAALGFQPSKAPALDASVAQFVPLPIMARYQQTASAGGAAGLSGVPYGGGPAVPAVPANNAATSERAVGGPEEMSGAVVANFNSLQAAAVAPAIYANPQGLPPAAVIAFAGRTTILSVDAKEQVKAAADSYTARGAGGYVRVVGHSAIASTKLSEARRLQINFESSQERAAAVMRELVKDGIPAGKILIDAVGDSGDGSSSAEIFFQG